MATITKTISATSRGQVTLPKIWRDRFGTNQYVLRAGDFKVEITPIDEEELEWLHGETIFNADRDNNGKGIKVQDFIKILENLKKEDGQNTKTSKKSAAKR